MDTVVRSAWLNISASGREPRDVGTEREIELSRTSS